MDLLKAGGFWGVFFNLQRVLPSPAAACGGLLMDLLIAAGFEGGGDYLIKMFSLSPFFPRLCYPCSLGMASLVGFLWQSGHWNCAVGDDIPCWIPVLW